ncbi:hypothetical protein GCM10009827_101410 [Dactylosporangium maewongense]|uniref:Transposase n=1 Tax=Dactylosporangium maewongense TaxID=634393 RepID=A0ABN2CWA0_9ACTN
MAAADTAERTTGTDRSAEPVRPGRWRTPAVRADMVRRHVVRREPMRETAVALGSVYSTVNKDLTHQGAQNRGRGGPTGRRQAPSSPTTARSRRLRSDGDRAPQSQADRRRPRGGVGDAGAVS